jgi:argininosuccinate lyase
MRQAADSPSLLAIDLAEFLVLRGVPFREAHGIIGALVRRSLEEGRPLVELVSEESRLGEAATALFEPGSALTRRQSPGSGGRAPVAAQLQRFAARLDTDRARLA